MYFNTLQAQIDLHAILAHKSKSSLTKKNITKQPVGAVTHTAVGFPCNKKKKINYNLFLKVT